MHKIGRPQGIAPRAMALLLLSFMALLDLRAQSKPDPSLYDDSLLREDWQDQESRRARGLMHRLSILLESPTSRFTVTDFAGRKFKARRKASDAR